MPMIPLDFVAGTHGNFLEIILNRACGFGDENFDQFTELGTSHRRSKEYLQSRQIVCEHWFNISPSVLTSAPKVIRIVFDQDDLLFVSSVSLLRSADLNIENDTLHIDTVNKLKNRAYNHMLADIYRAYDFLDRSQPDIPRNVLREFYKFGFRDPDINGLWRKLQEMLAVPVHDEYQIDVKNIYVLDRLVEQVERIGSWLDRPINLGPWLENIHSKFLEKIPYFGHKEICEDIIQSIIDEKWVDLPRLSLMQESYINARLEKIFGKEMPFHQIDYFTNTEDMLQYIKTQAPDI